MPRFPRRRARCATGGRSARITPPMPGPMRRRRFLPPRASMSGQPLAGDADAVDAARRGDGAQRRGAGAGPGRSWRRRAVGRRRCRRAGRCCWKRAGALRVCRSRCWPRRASRPCAFAPRDCVWCALGRAATLSSMPRSPASPMPSESMGGVAVTPGRMASHSALARSGRRCDRGGGRHRQRPERRHRAHARVDGRGVRARHRPPAGRDHGLWRHRLPTGAGVAGPARCGARRLASPGPGRCWRGLPAAASRNACGPPS